MIMNNIHIRNEQNIIICSKLTLVNSIHFILFCIQFFNNVDLETKGKGISLENILSSKPQMTYARYSPICIQTCKQIQGYICGSQH